MDGARLDVDLHLLELRFVGARLIEPLGTIPVETPEQRSRLGPSNVTVRSSPALSWQLNAWCWSTATAGWQLFAGLAAVLGVLARTQGRSFAAIEEALLLRELTQGLGVSQREAARRCARDGSWVNRRLQLLASLPEAALAAVREGRLSSWAAARMIASLARANSGHPDRLLRAQGQARLSTRELRQWFEHYQKARRGVRERMVEHPRLFLAASPSTSMAPRCAAPRRTHRLQPGRGGLARFAVVVLWKADGWERNHSV
jgi:ParB family transcriptional regulator, chromosome partitioning protein